MPCSHSLIPSRSAGVNPTLNLFHSAYECLKYFTWHSTPFSFQSRRNLNRLKSTISGSSAKAVILCNGPSLLNEDLSLLENVFTIGLNKINLLFDTSAFRPSCVVSVNPHVISQNRHFFCTTDIPVVLDAKSALLNSILPSSNKSLVLSLNGFPGFSTDITSAVCQSATVTNAALQLAYYLGFKEVAIIGCDHSFSSKGPDHKLVQAFGPDPNHFHPGYFAEGMKWNLPSLKESEEGYMRAMRFFEGDGRVIYNCTTGGNLEVFPRITLQEYLAKDS